MTEARTWGRLGELQEEARGLEGELRRLRLIESLGELDWTEEDRKGRIESRLRDIRGEADGIAATRRETHAERKRRAREAQEGDRRERISARERREREDTLIGRVVNTRRERMVAHGLGGISAGGQPKGGPITVQCANKVEREIALEFDARTEEILGVPASCVRDRDAEAYEFGVRYDFKRGEAVSVGEPSPVGALQGVPPWSV